VVYAGCRRFRFRRAGRSTSTTRGSARNRSASTPICSASSRSPAHAATAWCASRSPNVGCRSVIPTGPASRAYRPATSCSDGAVIARDAAGASRRTRSRVQPTAASLPRWIASTAASASTRFGARLRRCAAASVAGSASNPASTSCANSSSSSPRREENPASSSGGNPAISATPLRTGSQPICRRWDSSCRSAAAPR